MNKLYHRILQFNFLQIYISFNPHYNKFIQLDRLSLHEDLVLFDQIIGDLGTVSLNSLTVINKNNKSAVYSSQGSHTSRDLFNWLADGITTR